MIPEETVLEFAAALFRSVWALELLLALKRRGKRGSNPSDIIKELRASRVAVAEALADLVAAGLVVKDDAGNYRYRAATPGVDDMVVELERLYGLKPTSVIRKIVSTPNVKLQILSDAFRIKE